MRGIALLLIFSATPVFAAENFLRLYFMPSSPVRIEWDNPKNLVDSTIAAGFSNRNHAISHVNVEVQCRNPQVHFLAGAVSASKNISMQLLFEEKIGLSIMAGAWPGRLEGNQEIVDSLNYRGTRQNMLSAVTFPITAEACARITQYYRETEARSGSRYYGFAARPRRHEGAGCSAFAASFLEVAGIMTAEIRAAWQTQVRVPLSLMTTLGQSPRLSVQDILGHPEAQQWALPHQAHMDITIFDPDRMHEWVVALVNSESERRKFSAEIDGSLFATYPKIRAIQIDGTGFVTPNEPIFTGEPDLLETQPGFVVRKDLTIQPDGSFSLPPD